jgi:hypothetical protein
MTRFEAFTLTECSEVFSGNQTCDNEVNISYPVYPIHAFSDKDTGLYELTVGTNTVGSCVTHHSNPNVGGRDSLRNTGYELRSHTADRLRNCIAKLKMIKIIQSAAK